MDVVVEPGIGWMDLNEYLEPYGLFFPLDPGKLHVYLLIWYICFSSADLFWCLWLRFMISMLEYTILEYVNPKNWPYMICRKTDTLLIVIAFAMRLDNQIQMGACKSRIKGCILVRSKFFGVIYISWKLH